MKHPAVENWFNELQRVWLAKEIGGVKNLLSNNFSYYENPFEKPLTSWAEVEKVWQGINTQDISKLEIHSLVTDESEGTASYILNYTDLQGVHHNVRGAYYVKLDSEGKAVEFRRWRVSK